jgi:hypothetical protein
MVSNHKAEFDAFRTLHDAYALNPDALQTEFNEKGAKIQKLIREYEDKLCGRSEGSGYGSYSGNLAEKFQEHIRKQFPQIDMIGVIVKKPASFSVKKISL